MPDVGAGAAVRHDRESQVAPAIAEHAGHGESPKRRIHAFFRAFSAAADEVATDVPRLPTRTVERGQLPIEGRAFRHCLALFRKRGSAHFNGKVSVLILECDK